MNNKFYRVCTDTIDLDTFFYNKEEAIAEAKRMSNKTCEKVFVLESVLDVTPDINLSIDSFEAACSYLGYDTSIHFSGIADKHLKSMIAIYKLTIIAEVWNKADEFIPDFANLEQYKWYSRFRKMYGGVAYAGAVNGSSSAGASYGSRLAFKSKERAEQFGKQFIDLWNDFLL